MTWWSGCGDSECIGYDSDELRMLANAIIVQTGSIAGKQFAPHTTNNPAQVVGPYTYDYNKRPIFVAIFVALLELGRFECMRSNKEKEERRALEEMFPDAPKIARIIAARKRTSFKYDDNAYESKMNMSRYLRFYTMNALRRAARNPGACLTKELETRIDLFADTMERAAALYRAMIDAHVDDSRGIDLSFNVKYVTMAAEELLEVDRIDVDEDPPSLLFEPTANVQSANIHTM